MNKISDYYGLRDDERAVLEAAARGVGVDEFEIVVTRNDGLLKRFSTPSLNVNAVLSMAPPPLKCFVLYVGSEPEKPMPLLLCHEAVHMAQYARGDLSLDLDRKEFTWKGRKYYNTTDYSSRPWEIEAFSKEAKVLRDARKSTGGHKCSILSLFKNGKKK